MNIGSEGLQDKAARVCRKNLAASVCGLLGNVGLHKIFELGLNFFLFLSLLYNGGAPS